jgi:hypothetical protein
MLPVGLLMVRLRSRVIEGVEAEAEQEEKDKVAGAVLVARVSEDLRARAMLHMVIVVCKGKSSSEVPHRPAPAAIALLPIAVPLSHPLPVAGTSAKS